MTYLNYTGNILPPPGYNPWCCSAFGWSHLRLLNFMFLKFLLHAAFQSLYHLTQEHILLYSFFFSSIKKEQKNWKQNIKILPQNSWEGLNENLLRWKAHQIKFQAQEKKENNTPPKKTSPKNPVTSNGAIYTSSWKKPRKLVNSKHEFVKQKSLYIIKFFDDYNGICALGRNNCY